MGSIKEKIKYIKETKKLIREAIIAQGVDVPENTTFRDYANKIDSIKNTTHVSDNTTLASGTAVEKKIYYLEYLVLLGCDTLHLYNLIIIHNSIRNINTSPQII